MSDKSNQSVSPSKWIKRFIKSHEFEKIEQAILEAETKTSAEIIPMVVRRSSTVGHVPLILMLSFLLLTFAIGLPEIQEFYFDSIWVFVPLHLLAIVVVVGLFSRLNFICRWLTPKTDQIAQVQARAQLEFYNCETHTTRHNTGVLIFISLLEHQVVVLADKAIDEKNPPETWPGVVDKVVSGIRSEDLAEGLIAGIQKCGEILAKDFPIHADDTNELPNHLIIKE